MFSGIVWSEHSSSDHVGMCLEMLKWFLLFRPVQTFCTPDVHFAIFTATNHITQVVTEGRPDLTILIVISLEFSFQTLVSHVIETDAGIITCDQ